MGFWGGSSGGGNGKDSTSQPEKPTRDQEADAELAELIATLGQEQVPSKDGRKKRDGRERGEIEDDDASYGSAFPGEMNCITAFDEMFYCYSIGGQFLNGMLFPGDVMGSNDYLSGSDFREPDRKSYWNTRLMLRE